MADSITRDFIGRGWSFPFAFDARTGGVAKDAGSGTEQRLQRVENAVQVIINVKLGELFMSRDFGNQARSLIFKSSDADLYNLVEFAVVQAIEKWERRIRLDSTLVQADVEDRSRVVVEINYTIRRTNVVGNFVFPLYLPDAARSAAERGLAAG